MLQLPEKYRILDAAVLRWIALITMLIDHTAASLLLKGILLPAAPIVIGTPLYTLYLVYQVMRGIGRIAFPIFCFQLVEGFFSTKNLPRYMLRILLAGLLSEIPFDLALRQALFDWKYQNVMFTLLLGLCMMAVMERFKKTPVLMLLLGAPFPAIAHFLNTDYGWKGLALIAVLYFFRSHQLLQLVLGALSICWEWPAIFAFPLLALYNGKRGRSLPRLVTYLFYPAHLALLAVLLHLFFRT